MPTLFFRRKVQPGQKLGRKLGFPTVNFNVGKFGDHFRQGVYVCEVRFGSRRYTGLLYFGPKFSDRRMTLEIYIHDFSEKLYGQWVRFKVGRFIRGPRKFVSPKALQKQMLKDLQVLTYNA